MKEIGSEFYLNEFDLPIDTAASDLPFRQNNVYLRSGRDAIGYILDNIRPARRIALLPAYSCISMSEPFLRRGYRIIYYEIDSTFTPVLDDIKKAFSEEPDVMLYMDWFCKPVSDSAVQLARSLSSQAVLIEDQTHSFFSTHHKEPGILPDYTAASLRKWMALPDGAVASAYKSGFSRIPDTIPNEFVKLRKEALLAKGEYIKNSSPLLKESFRNLFLNAENSLDGGLSTISMSGGSIALYQSLDKPEMIKRRRNNYDTLYHGLSDIKGMTSLCGPLTEGICPFSYPVLFDNNRDGIQRELSEKGIYCPVLWPLPHEAAKTCRGSMRISQRMLSIPCDQRYDAEDMLYIVEAVKKLFSSKPGNRLVS